MAKITLKVDVSTKTKNGNFMNKLIGEGEKVKTAFGIVEGAKRTFYMFTDQTNAKGLEAEVELNNFDVVQRPYEFTDDDGKDQIAKLSYLYPKRA
jgi:hypothetical protein